jgi:ornithine carbamoyltransferase
MLGFPMKVATPKGYEAQIEEIKEYAASFPAYRKNWHLITLTNDPEEGVRGASVVNTDTWFSMGQEVSDEKRRLFEPFQLNTALMKKAQKDAIVLHCLPAHRGEEVMDDVLDGPQSHIWDEAENRLHVQKAVLEFLIKK